MKTINLSKMKIYTDLSRKEFVESDFKEQFANALYESGMGLAYLALGLKIFNSNGEIEINENEEKAITSVFKNMHPKLITAFCEQLGIEPSELINQ